MSLTPEQFNKLVTKDEFNEFKKIVATKEDMNNLYSAIDAVMCKLTNIEHAFVSNQAAHDRYEKRITRTEKELGLNPYSFSVANDK